MCGCTFVLLFFFLCVCFGACVFAFVCLGWFDLSVLVFLFLFFLCVFSMLGVLVFFCCVCLSAFVCFDCACASL